MRTRQVQMLQSLGEHSFNSKRGGDYAADSEGSQESCDSSPQGKHETVGVFCSETGFLIVQAGLEITA